MSGSLALLGDTLLTKDGVKPTAQVLAGKKVVGLYFSAHWCPPCRGFTPVLAKQYTDSYRALGLEIIFVSSDRDEAAFNDYYGEQPWVSLPFSDRAAKETLSKKFKVNGIPAFVLLDGETGELITTDGRAAVTSDPTGEKFPWKPPTVWEALGEEVLEGMDGDTKSIDEVRAGCKLLGLYFSAHWCPPCRGFTPVLASAYTDHLKAKGLEIIFVSSDKTPKEFADYYTEQPWLAIPQGDGRKEPLNTLFGVQGIPSLVLIDPATGKVINKDGRGAISADPKGENFPFHPKPYADMVKEGPGDINESPAFCIMMEGCDAAASAAAVSVLAAVSEAGKAQQAAGAPALLYLIATETGGPTEQIRQLTKLGAPVAGTASLVLLDIPDDGGYYVSPATEVTADTITGFVSAWQAKGLERQQLG